MSPIKIDPDILCGTPCFNGTRVPIRLLFSALEDSQSIDWFLEGYPTVDRQQVIAVLELAKASVAQVASVA